MKMLLGTGTISNYGNYINNCQANQFPYFIPVNSLADVQLYISIGDTKPDAVQYQLIHTCGALGGTIEAITTSDYVVAQDTNNNWYGVFKNFTSIPATCFVIGITLTFGETDVIYFSEEYCIESGCSSLSLLRGCYGHLDNKISYDSEGVYFGTGLGAAIGDLSVVYKHQLHLRDVEVTVSAIKNTFKQGRTRNFRTEKEKIFQFWCEPVPEWYLSEIDAVFYRGEVYVGAKKYLVNETNFEPVEECKRIWKAAATFKESHQQSFSCEPDPCAEIPTVCCGEDELTIILPVDVIEVPAESGVPSGIVIVSVVVGEEPVVTGTIEPVIGITHGSTVIISEAFRGLRVEIERGYIPVPDQDPLDGGTYYTKVIADNFITFSNAMYNGEYIKIQTIP